MKRIVENIKSFVLTFLIVLSLVLTGSLWFDNYQGLFLLVSTLPNNLVNTFSNNDEYSIIYDEIILPYKLTVINPDENRWIFYQNDIMTQTAWNIVKDRLNNVDESNIITGRIKEWENLIDRKSIIFEFSGTMDFDILKLLIPNLNKDSNAFNNVEKIAVTKSLDGNTIYVLQNNNGKKSLYKVLLKGDDPEIDNFMKSCENIKTNAKYLKLAEVGTTKFFGDKEVLSDNLVLFPVANTQSRRNKVGQIKVTSHINLENEYEINRFIIDIFNSTDFAKFVTTDLNNIFVNDDKSTIKFENNGVIEYINNSKLNEEVTSTGKNFNVAMNFIKSIKPSDNLFLISARDEDGTDTFRFSHSINGVVLGFETPIIENDHHAVFEIKVKNGSVRYFKGKLLNIEKLNGENYISNFTHNILDGVLAKVDTNTKINISLLEHMYLVDVDGNHYPKWIADYKVLNSDEEKINVFAINSIKR